MAPSILGSWFAEGEAVTEWIDHLEVPHSVRPVPYCRQFDIPALQLSEVGVNAADLDIGHSRSGPPSHAGGQIHRSGVTTCVCMRERTAPLPAQRKSKLIEVERECSLHVGYWQPWSYSLEFRL